MGGLRGMTSADVAGSQNGYQLTRNYIWLRDGRLSFDTQLWGTARFCRHQRGEDESLMRCIMAEMILLDLSDGTPAHEAAWSAGCTGERGHQAQPDRLRDEQKDAVVGAGSARPPRACPRRLLRGRSQQQRHTLPRSPVGSPTPAGVRSAGGWCWSTTASDGGPPHDHHQPWFGRPLSATGGHIYVWYPRVRQLVPSRTRIALAGMRRFPPAAGRPPVGGNSEQNRVCPCSIPLS
jgi:hypothetical protein